MPARIFSMQALITMADDLAVEMTGAKGVRLDDEMQEKDAVPAATLTALVNALADVSRCAADVCQQPVLAVKFKK